MDLVDGGTADARTQRLKRPDRELGRTTISCHSHSTKIRRQR
jgi:hypothetical protein